jgi:hypothetical protein
MSSEDYEDIILDIDVRYGDFQITLDKWISQELYKDPGFRIIRVTGLDGTQLSLNNVPAKYHPTTESQMRGNTSASKPLTLGEILRSKLQAVLHRMF